MSAAEKWPQFDELRHAICPTYSPEELDAIVTALRKWSKADPDLDFGRTARQHREALENLGNTLVVLSYVGNRILDSARESGVARVLEELLPRACEHIRTLRAISALSLGDKAALAGESPEIVEQARDAIRARGTRILARLSEEERDDYLASDLTDPAQTQAWLTEP